LGIKVSCAAMFDITHVDYGFGRGGLFGNSSPKVTEVASEEKKDDDDVNSGAANEEPWSLALRQSLGKGTVAPYKEFRRPMLSRTYAGVQMILDQNMEPGTHTESCCVVSPAPDYAPCLSIFPCIGEPTYIHEKREASKYILLRENSIEWNAPKRIPKQGALCAPHLCECCGSSCIKYDVMDHVSVVYYDDPMFERLTNRTRCCNGTREILCGGEGERVRIDASCLGGLCIRGSFPFCFIPCCVPECMAPCALQHNIMVKSKTEKWGGAKEAIKILQEHRFNALSRLPPLKNGKVAQFPEGEVMDRGDGLKDDDEHSDPLMRYRANVLNRGDDAARLKEIKVMTHHLTRPGPYSVMNLQRPMFTRVYGAVVQLYGVDMHKDNALKMGLVDDLETIGSTIPPGEQEEEWCACCHAPAYCPCCGILPCCMEPKYISDKRQASKYILVRENSLEWNDPTRTTAPGPLYTCGMSCCLYEIHDKVSLLYFDDPNFRRIRNTTRCCNDTRTACCGGRGERIRIDSPVCFNLCVRGTLPCPFVPVCCTSCCPCAIQQDIYVKRADGEWMGAKAAVKIINDAWEKNVYRLITDEDEQMAILGSSTVKRRLNERDSEKNGKSVELVETANPARGRIADEGGGGELALRAPSGRARGAGSVNL